MKTQQISKHKKTKTHKTTKINIKYNNKNKHKIQQHKKTKTHKTTHTRNKKKTNLQKQNKT